MKNISESELSQRIIIKARELFNCTLLRNNRGAFKNPHGAWVRFGLGNTKSDKLQSFKSSDYIGPTVVTITPEMVGKQVAIFTAVEFKEPGWKFNPNDEHEVKQKAFIDWINAIGGKAGFVKDLDSLIEMFRK